MERHRRRTLHDHASAVVGSRALRLSSANTNNTRVSSTTVPLERESARRTVIWFILGAHACSGHAGLISMQLVLLVCSSAMPLSLIILCLPRVFCSLSSPEAERSRPYIAIMLDTFARQQARMRNPSPRFQSCSHCNSACIVSQ